jgi:hypothetical protein
VICEAGWAISNLILLLGDKEFDDQSLLKSLFDQLGIKYSIETLENLLLASI